MRTASRVSFISIILIAIGLVVMSMFDIINDTVVTLITIITAIVGAFGIWLELNKEQEVNQASFILSINSDFYALGGKGTMYTAELEKKLDEDFSGVKKSKKSTKQVSFSAFTVTFMHLVEKEQCIQPILKNFWMMTFQEKDLWF